MTEVIKLYKEVTVTLSGDPKMDDVIAAISKMREQADAEFGKGGYTEETHFINRVSRNGFGTNWDAPCFMIRAVAR